MASENGNGPGYQFMYPNGSNNDSRLLPVPRHFFHIAWSWLYTAATQTFTLQPWTAGEYAGQYARISNGFGSGDTTGDATDAGYSNTVQQLTANTVGFTDARKRGARILAEIVGYGATGDAYHLTGQPEDHEGLQRAMRRALEDGGLQPEDVQYVNAHGTSTPLNDIAETRALRSVFGAALAGLAVTSTKGVTGHLLGAAGAVEAILASLALRDGLIPPWLGMYGFGEFARLGGANTFHNYTTGIYTLYRRRQDLA
jgi:hypothetical protein